MRVHLDSDEAASPSRDVLDPTPPKTHLEGENQERDPAADLHQVSGHIVAKVETEDLVEVAAWPGTYVAADAD